MPKILPELPSGTAEPTLGGEIRLIFAALILTLGCVGLAALLGIGTGAESTRASDKHHPDNRKPIFEMLLESRSPDSGARSSGHFNVWDDLNSRQ